MHTNAVCALESTCIISKSSRACVHFELEVSFPDQVDVGVLAWIKLEAKNSQQHSHGSAGIGTDYLPWVQSHLGPYVLTQGG